MSDCLVPGCPRERFVENGFTHPFCGRSHAIEAQRLGISVGNNSLPGSQRMCALVGCDQPVGVVESTQRVFDYCSETHRDLAKIKGEYPQRNTSLKPCTLSGCSRRRYVFPNGTEMDFCGKKHAEEYKSLQDTDDLNNNLVSRFTTFHIQGRSEEVGPQVEDEAEEEKGDDVEGDDEEVDGDDEEVDGDDVDDEGGDVDGDDEEVEGDDVDDEGADVEGDDEEVDGDDVFDEGDDVEGDDEEGKEEEEDRRLAKASARLDELERQARENQLIRIRRREQEQHGVLFCRHCHKILCPLNWLRTYVFTDDAGRMTTACVVAGHTWDEMKVTQREHPEQTHNKPFKYYCAFCSESVGTHWQDRSYDGPMLKCIDVGLQLQDGSQPHVKDWRTCVDLPRVQQVATPDVPFSLVRIPEDDRYANIKNQFDQSWLITRQAKYNYHKEWVKANLTAVYEILNQKLYNRLVRYQSTLRVKECKRLYHGTSQAPGCAIEQGRRCASGCALCSICIEGFDLTRAGKKWGRFGKGIYFGPTPAKSHDYNGNGDEKTGTRAMLLCLVELGRVKPLLEDAPTLTAAPAGFNSVWGWKQRHHAEGSLRFTERVVYTEKAAVASYVLFYKFHTRRDPPPR